MKWRCLGLGGRHRPCVSAPRTDRLVEFDARFRERWLARALGGATGCISHQLQPIETCMPVTPDKPFRRAQRQSDRCSIDHLTWPDSPALVRLMEMRNEF